MTNGESVYNKPLKTSGESTFKKETKQGGESAYKNGIKTSGESASKNFSSSTTTSKGESTYADKPTANTSSGYQNQAEIKKIYSAILAEIKVTEQKLKDLVSENDLIPEHCVEAKKIIKSKILALKEKLDTSKRKLLHLALENPNLFNVNVDNVEVNER